MDLARADPDVFGTKRIVAALENSEEEFTADDMRAFAGALASGSRVGFTIARDMGFSDGAQMGEG